MSGSNRFLLDANVFIEAYRRYYAFPICSGFWLALTRERERSRVFSIDRVSAELIDRNDDLARWTRAVPNTFFKRTADRQVVSVFADVMSWVRGERQFKPEATAEFAEDADGWLIAYAKVNGLILVTHEVIAPDAQAKVPIPNVCVEFGVPYVDTFEMLHSLKVCFGLRKRRKKN